METALPGMLLFIPWHFPLHKDTSIMGVSKQAELAFQKEYPAIYHHLLQYKDALSKRNQAETGIRYEWYALQRCAATYFPETNVLVPIDSVADRSNTPTSKMVIIKLQKHIL